MLAYVLAIVVGLGSFALYLSAFFFPEIHRKNDLIWSGVGLFYALVLWVYAGRITGGVLLGQIAGVALLGWLAWQTFLLRRLVAPVDQQTPLPTPEDVKAALSNLSSPEGRSQLTAQASQLVTQVKQGIQGAIASARSAQSRVDAGADAPYVPPKLEEFGTAGKEAVERFARAAIAEVEPVEDSVREAAATVNEAAVEALDQVQTRAEDVGEVLSDQLQSGQAAVSRAVSDTSESVSESVKVAATEASKVVSTSTGKTRAKAKNILQVITETIQSLFKGGTGKKESKPVYVRKQFRDSGAETSPLEKASTVAAVAIETVTEITSTEILTAEGTVLESVTEVETIETVTEIPISQGAAEDGLESVAEVVSEELLPDLLGVAPLEGTTEEIVEELLEDISAQEEGDSPSESVVVLEGERVLEAVPTPEPGAVAASDWGEAAIADVEEQAAVDALAQGDAAHGEQTAENADGTSESQHD